MSTTLPANISQEKNFLRNQLPDFLHLYSCGGDRQIKTRFAQASIQKLAVNLKQILEEYPHQIKLRESPESQLPD